MLNWKWRWQSWTAGEQNHSTWCGAAAAWFWLAGWGAACTVLQALAGGGTWSTCHRFWLPVPEAKAVNHLSAESHSGTLVLRAPYSFCISLLRPRGFWGMAGGHINTTWLSLTLSFSILQTRTSQSKEAAYLGTSLRVQPTVVWSTSLSTWRDRHAAGVQKLSCAHSFRTNLHI